MSPLIAASGRPSSAGMDLTCSDKTLRPWIVPFARVVCSSNSAFVRLIFTMWIDHGPSETRSFSYVTPLATCIAAANEPLPATIAARVRQQSALHQACEPPAVGRSRERQAHPIGFDLQPSRRRGSLPHSERVIMFQLCSPKRPLWQSRKRIFE